MQTTLTTCLSHLRHGNDVTPPEDKHQLTAPTDGKYDALSESETDDDLDLDAAESAYGGGGGGDAALDADYVAAAGGGGPGAGCCPPARGPAAAAHCAVCVYLATGLLLIGCLVALVVITMQVVLPYTQVLRYVPATCVPSHVAAAAGGQTCLCGAGCTARYRCLSVSVRYRLPAEEGSGWRNSTLYDSEAVLNKKCSYYPACQSSPASVQHDVDAYQQQYATPGVPFPCLVPPGPPVKPPRPAIRARRYHAYHVVNGLLWTMVIATMAAALLGWAVRRRRRRGG